MASRESLIVRLQMPPSWFSIGRQARSLPAPTHRLATGGSSSNSTPTEKITAHFTQSQIALALTIQKSKPEGLSTIEYCQTLRKRVKTNRTTPEEDLRFIDTCEFWKGQYTKIHLEKKALQDKIHCLEEAQRQLRMRFEEVNDNDSQDFDGPTRYLTSMEQSGKQPELEASRQPPVVARTDSWLEDQGADTNHSFADDSLLRLSGYVLRIARQREHLEQTTAEYTTLDHITLLTNHTLQILKLLENTLSDCSLPLKLLRTSDDPRTSTLYQHLMHQAALSFLSCFKTLNELCRTIPGRAKKAEIVYKMVMFFNKALNLLQTVINLQTEHEAVRERRKSRHKRCRVDEGEYVVNKYLAKSLASIAYGLEWKADQPGHSDLLEGILFSVLEHIGRLVSEAVFAEHVATSDKPGNITKNSPSSPAKDSLESRYMIKVLYAALGGSDRKDLVARVLATGKRGVTTESGPRSSVGSSLLESSLLSPDKADIKGLNRYSDAAGKVLQISNDPSGDLFYKQKKLIQSTLLKSAVGGAELETLRLPTPPAEESISMLGVHNIEGRFDSDWLIETVWALIGWDLMA